jgi:DNA polymerase-3 subunit delta'
MIIGHQQQWEFLKKSVQDKKIAHAYLFYGPSQIGKKRVAIEFAKYLNCVQTSKEDKPCQKCQICYQIEKKIYPDLVFIEPDPEKLIISIEQIRELKRKLSLTGKNKGYKVAIIDQAHKLNFDAQSALLKQLEEPRGEAVIILISEYPQKILPTVISRCQKIRFSFVPSGLIKKEMSIDSNEKLKYPFLFNGRVGFIINSLSNPEERKKWERRIKEIDEIRNKDLYLKFQYAKEVAQTKHLESILEVWLAYFRDLMHKVLANENEKNFWNLEELKKILHHLQEIHYLISTTNINPKLALELFFLEL